MVCKDRIYLRVLCDNQTKQPYRLGVTETATAITNPKTRTSAP